VKSRGSARKMSCAEELIELLSRWKQESQFTNHEDWIFASPFKLGRQPLCYTLVWKRLSEGAVSAGIGHVSSHVFSPYIPHVAGFGWHSGWGATAINAAC